MKTAYDEARQCEDGPTARSARRAQRCRHRHGGSARQYDAFGNTLRESGPYAASNPFRYSTKYTDIETGLVYYGLRYYSPTLGRFINQDPIEEQGGLNVYGFCGNNGINRWDYLGMDPIIMPGPGSRTAIILNPSMTIFVGGDTSASGRVGMTLGGNVNIVEDKFHSDFFWASDGDGSSSSIGRMANALASQNVANQIAAASNAGSLAADSAFAGYASAAPNSGPTAGQRWQVSA